jgi:uracil-DNA glycosylase family 4
MIIGEAPGSNEENTGLVFSGRAGQLLDTYLASAGLADRSPYISNVVKCRPPDNRSPERIEWKTCYRYFLREVKTVRPRGILLLGNVALNAVTGKSGITKHRGVRLTSRDGALKGCPIMATIHPAYVLRNPGQGPTFGEDLRRFARLLDGQFQEVPVRTKLIRTTRQVKQLAQKIRAYEGIIAYDTEDKYAPWHPEWAVVLLGVSFDGEVGYVVPLDHPDSELRSQWKPALRLLAAALRGTRAKLVAQSGKHDNLQLAGVGQPVEHSFDLLLAAHLLDENRPKNLGFLAQTYLGADVYKGSVELAPEKIQLQSLRDLAIYNSHDVGYTHQIYPKVREELVEQPRLTRLFSKLLMPGSHTIQKVEYRGVYIDRDRLWDRIVETQKMVKDQLSVLEEHGASSDLNPNSPQQLARWLYASEREGGLGLTPILNTPTGRPSTREAVLLHYRDHPAVRALLRYRTLQLKWLNTCLLPWSARIDRKGRLHTSYKIYGTVTGRLSGDLQQVPRDPFIRGVFGAPLGWSFVVADFSQIELRIAAHCAQERRMTRAFWMKEDLHLATASTLTGKSTQDVTKEERKLAKAVNFGFLYGMGWSKFITYAFESFDLEVSKADAQTFRQQYFETFPGLLPWHRRQERVVRSLHYVSSPIGRVRHLPDVLSSDMGVAAEAVRQAINSPVQSCASDLMLFSMVLLDKVLDPQEAFMVMTLHDGIMFQVKEDAVAKVGAQIKDVMENLPLKKTFGAELSVPVVADVEYGQHWGEPVGVLETDNRALTEDVI